jgi:hypothetical protein
LNEFGDAKLESAIVEAGDRPLLEEKTWKDGETKMNALLFIGRDFDAELLKTALLDCEARIESAQSAVRQPSDKAAQRRYSMAAKMTAATP